MLVATSRVLDVLMSARVKLDALIGSATDPDEIYLEGSLDPSPDLVVRTDGENGGTFAARARDP